jgi:hypothetical protein
MGCFQTRDPNLVVETVEFFQPGIEIDDQHHQKKNSCNKRYPSPIDM